MICSKALNHFLFSTYVINLKVKLGPTDLIYLVPPSSPHIATARNPDQFGLTDGISVSSRWPCKLSVTYCSISIPPKCAVGPTEFAWPSLCLLIAQIGLTKVRFCPNPSTSIPPSWPCRSHRKLERSHFQPYRSDRVSLLGPTEFGRLCVTARFCVEAIYTPPPPSSFERVPSERAYTSTTHFLRENHLLLCWDQHIPILQQESWSLAFPKLLSTQIIFRP